VSFDNTLPSNRDRCRALVGDTDEANELFSDDHYDAVEAQQTSFELFVAFIADELVAVYAQEPDRVGLSDGIRCVDGADRRVEGAGEPDARARGAHYRESHRASKRGGQHTRGVVRG
jgi:hypothetical protein